MNAPSFFHMVVAGVLLAGTARSEKISSWDVQSGDFGVATNWKPKSTPELASKLRWELRNGGTATVSAGQTYGLGLDLLIATASGSGTLSLDGDGSLTIKRYLSIGHSGIGEGQVLVNDTASLVIENGTLLVGQRSSGILKVAKGASAVVQVGNTKIAEGMNGTVELAGTLETPDLLFGNRGEAASEQNGTLNCEPGSTFKSGKRIVFATTGNHVVQISGSGGQFLGGSLVASSVATFRFIADARGVTPIELSGTCDITGAMLEVNLDAYAFKNSQEKVMLFGTEALTGEFASVKFLGKTKGAIKYDKKGIFFTR